VVAATGLSLDAVANGLNELAYETKADLEVTSSGLIYYSFPADLHFRLYSSRLAALIHRAWALVSPVLNFAFRISFGLMLLLSLLFVSSIMLVLQLMMAAASGNTTSAVDLLKDYFALLKRLAVLQHVLPSQSFFKQKLVISDQLSASPESTTAENISESQKDQGFLLNCYSFLFGPGDPNRDFEAYQSYLAAQLIREKHGIVLPDELAPYTGVDPNDTKNMFPYLARFNGMPATTPSGQLIYLFPDLQAGVSGIASDTHALSSVHKHKHKHKHKHALNESKPANQPMIEDQWTEHAEDEPQNLAIDRLERSHLPDKLLKQKLLFAGIGRDAMLQTVALAGANFVGTLFFWWLLFAARSSSINTTNIFLLLAVYAAFFLLVPAIRWVLLQFENAAIQRYNQRIEQFAKILEEPSSELISKLKEAERMRQEAKERTTPETLVYTTKRDFLEQEADRLSEPM